MHLESHTANHPRSVLWCPALSACCPAQAEETETAYKKLTEFLKSTLGERVEKVSISNRLADSPCALVTSKFGWSAYQERIMKSQVSPSHCQPCTACWFLQPASSAALFLLQTHEKGAWRSRVSASGVAYARGWKSTGCESSLEELISKSLLLHVARTLLLP